MYKKLIEFNTSIALILSLCVVILGAYTRLSNAGLSCPDWPWCYGHLFLPQDQQSLKLAQQVYPQFPLVPAKAWIEMVHRYLAGILALLILGLAITNLWNRVSCKKYYSSMTDFLLILVIFQGILGMLTVTLQLTPVIVMGHLLGGLLIFATLCCLKLEQSQIISSSLSLVKSWVWLGVALIFIQLMFGGLVSSYYAGLSCVGFPKCNGVWLPKVNVTGVIHSLILPLQDAHIQEVGVDGRVLLQMIHRLLAVITLLYITGLSTWLFLKLRNTNLYLLLIGIVICVIVQFILGIINVVYFLPLWSAIAHNCCAALLFAFMAMLLYLTKNQVS